MNDEAVANGDAVEFCTCGNKFLKIGKRITDTCYDCSKKKAQDKFREYYLTFPFKEYDGSVVFSRSTRETFRSKAEILKYCIKKGVAYEDLLLTFCKPIPNEKIDKSYWIEEGSGDFDEAYKKEIECCLLLLNSALERHPPIDYYPIDVRTEFNPYQTVLNELEKI